MTEDKKTTSYTDLGKNGHRSGISLVNDMPQSRAADALVKAKKIEEFLALTDFRNEREHGQFAELLARAINRNMTGLVEHLYIWALSRPAIKGRRAQDFKEAIIGLMAFKNKENGRDKEGEASSERR